MKGATKVYAPVEAASIANVYSLPLTGSGVGAEVEGWIIEWDNQNEPVGITQRGWAVGGCNINPDTGDIGGQIKAHYDSLDDTAKLIWLLSIQTIGCAHSV